MNKQEQANWKKEMLSLISKWKEFGMNQKDFFRQHDLTMHAFYYWLRKYKKINTPSFREWISTG